MAVPILPAEQQETAALSPLRRHPPRGSPRASLLWGEAFEGIVVDSWGGDAQGDTQDYETGL